MELDIKEFEDRLQLEKQKAQPNVVALIYEEIRLAENMKAGLLEEMNQMNKDFLVQASSVIDTYMFGLKQIERELNLVALPLDQEVALRDTMHDEMINKIAELEDLKKKLNKTSKVIWYYTTMA